MPFEIGGKASLRSARSYFSVTGPDGNVGGEGDAFSCPHCGMVVHVVPGSGKTRGWCAICGRPTCGKRRCHSCVPLEKQLEKMESRSRLLRDVERC